MSFMHTKGPAVAGSFLYEKTQGKTSFLEAIDSKKRHNRQRTRTMGKEPRNCPVYPLMAQLMNRRKT